ncbi:hypothetical protein HKX48_000750 [Thoreauomyces humboldtii]|nr:hypothetical protein HKX48_000750 [Thoreauomyces humboldtii]
MSYNYRGGNPHAPSGLRKWSIVGAGDRPAAKEQAAQEVKAKENMASKQVASDQEQHNRQPDKGPALREQLARDHTTPSRSPFGIVIDKTRRSPSETPDPQCCLWISNLPEDVDREALESWARQQGTVISFDMEETGKSALALYLRPSSVDKILHKYGNWEFQIKGRPIQFTRVRPSSPPDSSLDKGDPIDASSSGLRAPSTSAPVATSAGESVALVPNSSVAAGMKRAAEEIAENITNQSVPTSLAVHPERSISPTFSEDGRGKRQKTSEPRVPTNSHSDTIFKEGLSVRPSQPSQPSSAYLNDPARGQIVNLIDSRPSSKNKSFDNSKMDIDVTVVTPSSVEITMMNCDQASNSPSPAPKDPTPPGIREDLGPKWTYEVWKGDLFVKTRGKRTSFGKVSITAREAREDLDFGDEIAVTLDNDYVTRVQKEMFDDPRAEVFFVRSAASLPLGVHFQDGLFILAGISVDKTADGKPNFCIVPMEAFASLPASMLWIRKLESLDTLKNTLVAVYLSGNATSRPPKRDNWRVSNCFVSRRASSVPLQSPVPQPPTSPQVVVSREDDSARQNQHLSQHILKPQVQQQQHTPQSPFFPPLSALLRRQTFFEAGRPVQQFTPFGDNVTVEELMRFPKSFYVSEGDDLVPFERWMLKNLVALRQMTTVTDLVPSESPTPRAPVTSKVKNIQEKIRKMDMQVASLRNNPVFRDKSKLLSLEFDLHKLKADELAMRGQELIEAQKAVNGQG